MTLQQLQYLVALAESNSINQAAQNLFVSQSGISKAIKQLESELGFPLLERSSRGITFTSRGTEFLHDAYSLIKQFHTMQDHYLQTEPQGMITMSITSRYYIFVAKAVAKMANLLKDHNYFIRLQEGKVSDIIQDVEARRSQLGFISYYDTSMSLSASIWNSTVFAATSSMFSCPRTIRLPKNPISPSPCSVLTHISSTTAARIHTAILRRSFSPYIRKNPSLYQTVAPC